MIREEQRTWVKVVEAAEDGGVELADAGGVARGALAGLPVALDGAQQGDLDHHHRKQGQRVVDDAPGHREVVQRAPIEHLCAGLEPGASLDRCAVGLERHTWMWGTLDAASFGAWVLHTGNDMS